MYTFQFEYTTLTVILITKNKCDITIVEYNSLSNNKLKFIR